MVISLIKKDGYDRRTLRFSKMAKAEYLIVSKKFETPRDGASSQVIGGKWYLFTLTLHEYKTIDPETLDKVESKEEEVVSFFSADSKSEKTGEITQGTVLRALLESPVDQKLKITMYNNEEGMPRYKVDVVGASSAPTPSPVKQNESFEVKAGAPDLYSKMLQQAKNLNQSGLDKTLIKQSITATYVDAPAEDVEKVLKEIE